MMGSSLLARFCGLPFKVYSNRCKRWLGGNVKAHLCPHNLVSPFDTFATQRDFGQYPQERAYQCYSARKDAGVVLRLPCHAHPGHPYRRVDHAVAPKTNPPSVNQGE